MVLEREESRAREVEGVRPLMDCSPRPFLLPYARCDSSAGNLDYCHAVEGGTLFVGRTTGWAYQLVRRLMCERWPGVAGCKRTESRE